MKVVVAGVDYAPRPHMVSWFAKAFRRLGCDVVVVGADSDVPVGDDAAGQVDAEFEPPAVRTGGRTEGRPGAGGVLSAAGGADLLLMVDCGEDWAVVNDGSCPYVYVWREGNPGEYARVGGASNGAPVFCCMINKGTQWPDGTQFMPFAADRSFLYGPLITEREVDFVYTGRERANTYSIWRHEAPTVGLRIDLYGYVFPYTTYRAILRGAKMTGAADSGRYVASRGIEALAAGQIVWWDGGEALDRMGLVGDRDYMRCQPAVWDNGDTYPCIDWSRAVDLRADVARMRMISEAAVAVVRNGHTYEHRAATILAAVGLKSPLTVDEAAEQYDAKAAAA